MSRWLGACLIAWLVFVLIPPGVAPAAEGEPVTITNAVLWLREQQNADGGFGSPASSPSLSVDTLLGLAAAGVDVSSVSKNGRTLVDFLASAAPEYGSTPAGAAKLTLAASAVSLNPRAFGGRDLVATITSAQTAEGQYGQSLYAHGYAVLALAAAGEPINARAIERITSSQIADGAWGFAGPGQPGDGDTNTTALLLQALVAGGQANSPALPRALAYLKASLAPGGGFAYAPGEGTLNDDANSTALVVQALLALNEAPDAATWGGSLRRLQAFQNATGAFRWRDDQPADNLLATIQALPALSQRYFPFQPGDATGTRARRLAARPLPPFVSTPERHYFPETGHSVALGFKYFWDTRGGWEIFGLSLTEEFREVNPDDGQVYTVQYFERARFEYHPEHQGTPFETQLGLLGRFAAAGRDDLAFQRIPAAPEPDCIYTSETGHAVCGPFLVVWQERDGLFTFGLPLSEPYKEGAALVQYFERTRMEYTAGAMKFGLLGREILYRPRLAGAR